MASVREASFELFRRHGMTTMFGNPGSTELPMLAEFPDDFRYVLGLQEAAVVGMADGYAQASGQVTHVNLHTAPGVGNAMGAIFNAQANKSPLLVTAGQQVRAQITMQANLTNRDAARVPHPFVKWSYEAARAQDVPLALARGIHLAQAPPRGPAFVSVPMDDWSAEVDGAEAELVAARTVDARAGAGPEAIAALAGRLEAASSPVMVAGPDIDAAGAWEDAVALAERQKLPVFASPAPGGGPPRLSREPSPLPGGAAARDRPGHRDAARQGPDPGGWVLGLPLLPLHTRAAPARGRRPGRDHIRSRRSGAGADGGRHRRGRGADAPRAGRGGRRSQPRRADSAARAGGRRGDRPADADDGPQRAGRRLPR